MSEFNSSPPSALASPTTESKVVTEPRVFIAEPLVVQPNRQGWLRWSWNQVRAITHWLFGLFSLIVILSILATVPVLQFMSLGYLLEATGRVVQTRRLRSGFIGISQSARVGSIGLGVFLSLLPLRFVSSLWYSSLLLNGDSGATRGLRALLLVLSVLVTWHIGWAMYRGGKLRHFAWPAPLRFVRTFRQGGMYTQASTRLAAFVSSLHLSHFFSLGLRGFLGASVWLCIPISLMAVSTKADDLGFGGLLAFVGGFSLAWVLVYLPFLQARVAFTNRFSSQFEIREVRRQFQRAPIAYWFALLLTLTLAIPLYLLKAELIPREAAWLPSLFFVTFMYPARLGVGWAIARAERREQPRHWISRWSAWLGLLPVTLIYALIAYFTQFTSWYGSLSLYEQHAFLVPVPFLGY